MKAMSFDEAIEAWTKNETRAVACRSFGLTCIVSLVLRLSLTPKPGLGWALVALAVFQASFFSWGAIFQRRANEARHRSYGMLFGREVSE